MEFERRSFLTALAFIATTGCALAKSAIGSPMLDPLLWRAYKARFFLPEGRIIDNGNGGVSHSEGQGYGMILATAAGDRDAFDTMARWTQQTLLRKDVALHSWRFVPGQANPVPDPNNATDGDLLIAWAYLAAGRRWGRAEYLRQSAAIQDAILRKLIVKRQGFTLLLPGLLGFEDADRVVINPSYYVWPAIDAFERSNTQSWGAVRQDGLQILKLARFGPLELPADWLEIKGERVVEPAKGRDPVFGFEGIRIPLYCLMSGRRGACDNVTRYWNALCQSGKPLPAWVNVVTGQTAPYPLSEGVTSIAERLIRRHLSGAGNGGDYYSSTLALMNKINL